MKPKPAAAEEAVAEQQAADAGAEQAAEQAGGEPAAGPAWRAYRRAAVDGRRPRRHGCGPAARP